MSFRHLSYENCHHPGGIVHKICFQENTAVMTTELCLRRRLDLEKVKPTCLQVKGSHFYIHLSVNIMERTGKGRYNLYFHYLRRDQKSQFVPPHSYRTCQAKGSQSHSVLTHRKLFWIMLYVDEAKEPEHFLLIITSSCWPAKHQKLEGRCPT